MNNRPARLLLIVIAIAYLSRDFRDAVAIAPPPIIKISAPQAPTMTVTTPVSDIAERKTNARKTIADLNHKVELFLDARMMLLEEMRKQNPILAEPVHGEGYRLLTEFQQEGLQKV